jgi:hypothetical protein
MLYSALVCEDNFKLCVRSQADLPPSPEYLLSSLYKRFHCVLSLIFFFSELRTNPPGNKLQNDLQRDANPTTRSHCWGFCLRKTRLDSTASVLSGFGSTRAISRYRTRVLSTRYGLAQLTVAFSHSWVLKSEGVNLMMMGCLHPANYYHVTCLCASRAAPRIVPACTGNYAWSPHG